MDPEAVRNTRAPCVLCRTCINWSAHEGTQRCGAGVRAQRDTWWCDHYVREFRPLRAYDRRRTPRPGSDRRRSSRASPP